MTLIRMSAVFPVLLVAAVGAQDPAFDVASVRPNTTPGTAEIRPMPNGRFTATNATLRSLILRAYKLHDSQLINAPEWTRSERFDIDARTAAPPADGPESMMPMVRALLADRFRLRAHTETRELPAYVLTLARGDRRLGSQIKPTAADCSKATTLTQDEIRAAAREGWPPCGMVYVVSYVVSEPGSSGMRQVKMRVRRSGITLRDFAATLPETVGRPVVDATGLDGRFDIEYSYSAQPMNPNADSPFGPDAPGVFVAFDEQLGLKLESQRATVPVLVIDSIERPAVN